MTLYFEAAVVVRDRGDQEPTEGIVQVGKAGVQESHVLVTRSEVVSVEERVERTHPISCARY